MNEYYVAFFFFNMVIEQNRARVEREKTINRVPTCQPVWLLYYVMLLFCYLRYIILLL